jgi:hypothetical protein
MAKSITPERRVDMLIRQGAEDSETSWNAGASYGNSEVGEKAFAQIQPDPFDRVELG